MSIKVENNNIIIYLVEEKLLPNVSKLGRGKITLAAIEGLS